MHQPRRSLPAALPTRSADERPSISGEYRISITPAEPPSGRYGTPPVSNRVLDEYDFDIHAWGALELEDERRRRSLEPPPPASFTPAEKAPRRTTSSSTIAAIDPHAMIVAFAGFGADPSSIWATPRYAFRAMRRKRALLRDLEIAREHRPQEAGTIEAALRTMDATSVRRGFILVAAYVVLVAALLFAAVQLVMGLVSPA